MLLEAAIYSQLSTYAGLAALTGTRIYPLLLPQDPTLPAVTYQTISRVMEEVRGAGPRYAETRVQIDCWAASYSSAKAVAEQVRAALQDYTGTMGGAGGVPVLDGDMTSETDVYEPDALLHRVMVEALITHRYGVMP